MIPFRTESWIWYSCVTAVLLARIISRTVHFGSVKRLQIDDWLMLLVLAFYTADIVTVNIVSHSETNLLPPEYLKYHIIGPKEKAAREYGSKIVLVVEQCQCATIWLVKACILIMYHRLTKLSYPTQNLIVKILAGYVAGGYVLMDTLWFGVWCRPFSDYIAVPTPNPTQCAAAINHLITNAVLNLSSDVILLVVALPLFLRSNLPVRRKMALCGVFGLGIFVILCAVLNKYYSFTHPFGDQWVYWYCRESSTSVLVANVPFTWNLVRKLFGDTALTEGDSSRYIEESASSNKSIEWLKQRLGVKRGQSYGSRSKASLTSNGGVSRHPGMPEAERVQSTAKPALRTHDPYAIEAWEDSASLPDYEKLNTPPKEVAAPERAFSVP